MKKTKAGDTLQELCPKCGEHIASCTCGHLLGTSMWPMSGDRPRSEGEMSARFSELKEAGSGTFFADAITLDNQAPISIGLAHGAIIGGVYKIIRFIGSGAMGEVYLAKHMTLDKDCALKVIPPEQVTEIGWQRFQLEARSVAKLDHVNIVRVTDLGIHDGCLPFYAMEFLDGQNLAEVLTTQGPLPLGQTLEIFKQTCDGVSSAHRSGILHRDLKPANIMLTYTKSAKLVVKILDFGLAKLTRHDRQKQSLTAEGEVFGSPFYMSPEQGMGAEIDARSDIYSVGCALFKTLTGRPPFSGDGSFQTILLHQTQPVPRLDSALKGQVFPPALEELVQKMLAKRPEERYQSMEQVGQAIARLQLEAILPQADKAGQEGCPTCGMPVAECVCIKLPESANWPMTGDRPRSEGEMTARFSQLKEAGASTTFIQSVNPEAPPGVTPIDLAPDAIIGGVYKIIKLIGYGAMGEVYLAKHMTLNKKCALKVIPPDQVTEVAWQRFQLEAKTVAKLDHVNLVKVTDLGIHDGCLPYYAMEYLQGENLAEALADHGPIPLAKVLEIFIQVCDGIECAHRGGIMHRDLKPANIMLIQALTGKMEVKILDFGLAKLTKHNRFKQSLTAVGDVFGSPSYMSPEQCSGEELDPRSDIYSIGCTLFECLTGRPPFVGQMAAQIFMGHLVTEPPSLESVVGPGKFPPALEEVLAKLLKKDLNERYQTLSELKDDLERIAGGKRRPPPGAAKKDSRKGRSKPSGSRHQGLPARRKRNRMPLLLGLGLVVLLGGGGYVFYKARANKAARSEAVLNQVTEHNHLTPIAVAAKASSAGSVLVDDNGNQIVDDADDKWDGTPFYKGIVVQAGRNLQHWSYKSDHPPLVSLAYEGPHGLQRIGLSGDVFVPAAARVSLFFRQQPVYPLIRLKALEGGNFDEVNFGRYSLKDVEMMVPILSKCKSIKSIRLGDSGWSPEDARAAVSVINQFPNVERIGLYFKCEPSTLTGIHRLKDLNEIRLGRTQPNLRDCLKLLSGQKNLTSLGALGWSLPSGDLKLVADFPNLEKLTIGRLTGTHDQLLVLAKLPRLQQLDMPALRYRADLLADLRLLKSLKVLNFALSSEWNNDLIAQLQQDLPDVRVVVSAMMSGGRKHSGGRRYIDRSGRPPSADRPAVPQSTDQPLSPKSGDQAVD